MLDAHKKSDLNCKAEGCYAGGSGTWIIIEGGPFLNEKGRWEARKLSIVGKAFDYIRANGQLSAESYPKYHSKSGMPTFEGRAKKAMEEK